MAADRMPPDGTPVDGTPASGMPADGMPPDGVPPGGVPADEPLDPTRQLDQPALTTSTGLIWLVVGGIFAAISLAVLIPMAALPQGGVAIAAAVLIALLYAGMVVARLALPPGRRRLGLMATGMLLIAAVALVGTLIVAFATAESLAG